ncbi:MAG: hypothetical protein AAF266_08710 [Planctomycetota bacterium]
MRSIPRPDNAESTAAWRRAYWHAVIVVVLCSLGSSHAAESLVTRLRVSLEAPEAIAWRGELFVESGRLEKLQPLSLEPSAAASTSLVDGRVQLHHRKPTRRDVFDITVRRSRGAKLALRLVDRAGEPVGRAAIDLDAVMNAPQSSSLGDGNAAIGVSRLDVDRLRIETDRQSLLFAPADAFAFDVLADPAGVAQGEPYDFVCTLSRGRSGKVIWQSESTRHETPSDGPARIPLEVTLPSDEGVYRITLRASRPSGFLSRFPTGGTPPPLAERSFLIAVFDADAPPSKPGDWETVYTFDPSTHTWADRVPEWMRWRRLPWFAAGPLSSQAEDLPISPASVDGEAHWRAYPLPIAEPGSTYAVEVETLGEPGDELTLAVMEPDALGDLRPVSGVVTRTIPRWNRSAKRPEARLLVRPRTASPLLVIANPNGERTARFGKIRLLKSCGSSERREPTSDRFLAVDHSEVDLPHAMGASHVASGLGRFEHADLQTHIETARALADRVEFAEANAAVVSVNGRGGAMYPSQHWASPAQDLGQWQTGAADLPRRELLTAIVREFQRRGLRLIPAVTFDAPTALLEQYGRTVRYNAADEAVIGARLAIIEELLDIVGDSTAIAGVAVRIGESDWALLPPGVEPADAAINWLESSYESLSRSIELRLGTDCGLHLLPSALVNSGDIRRALEPRLGNSSENAERLLASTGLRALGELGTQLCVAVPHPVTSDQSGLEPAVLAAFRRALPASGSTALIARRETVRLINSATRLRRNSSGPASDVRLLATRVSLDREAALTLAADASPMLLLGGSHSVGWVDPASSQQLGLLAQLPLGEREGSRTSSKANQAGNDLVTRSIDTPDGQSVAVVANHSAWDRTIHATIDVPTQTRGGRIDADDLDASFQWFDPGRHVIDVELAAYDSIAWRFDTLGVRIDGVRVEPAVDARRELAEALDDLQSRDTTQRRSYDHVANPSFESESSTGETIVAGWTLGPGATSIGVLAIDGDAAVSLRATDARTATVTSDPFPVPSTGQLVLGLQVAAREAAPDAGLLIELEEVDGTYRKSARLGAAQLASNGNAGDDAWLPVMFPIDDLPLATDAQLRLRFTLSGSGEVVIDDLRLEDLVLPLDGYEAIDLRAERFAVVRLLTAAENALRDGRLEACREHVESYWARFLVENFPRRDDSPTLVENAEPSEEAPSEEAEATPSLSERLRGYLPRWWR